MANRTKVKCPINNAELTSLIKETTSIRKLALTIGYSDKTIRRGLQNKEMSIELVMLLGKVLEVNPALFADFDEYSNRLLALKEQGS